MTRLLTVLAAALALALPLPAVPLIPLTTDQSVTPIDLKAHLNVTLKENLHSDRQENNNLAALPTGKQKLAGVEFHIGDGIIQLGSMTVRDKPDKVEGIPVGRTFKKLHIVHACGYTAAPDTLIGKYLVHYDDESKAEITIVYGQDVIDWWAFPDRKPPARSKVAWEGDNHPAKGSGAKLKLYLTTWENPHPRKKVVTIDFVSTATKTEAAPFCVAMTADGK
jgi:hypothetical protein